MANVYEFKDFEGSSHRILIDLLFRHCARGGKLLDLGASAGHLGRSVRAHFGHSVGFEYEVACVGTLRDAFDAVVIADLEKLEQLPGDTDAVVLADVLEHLRDAGALLRLVRESLRPGGHLFVSVPNIANITVRLGLLFGIFEYRERGILDNTHLRFYTLRTICREIEAAGFRIVSVHGSSIPVRLIVGKWMPEGLLRGIERLLTLVTSAWKALFAYQIIVVATRTGG